MTFAVRSPGVLTDQAVHDLITRALAAVRRHDAVDELTDCLAPHGLVLHLPGRTLRGRQEVRRWYLDLTRRYVLTCRAASDAEVRLTSPLHAESTLDVAWSARPRRSPAAVPAPAPLPAPSPGHTARLSLSAVLQDGAPRIRTCAVHLLPVPLPPA